MGRGRVCGPPPLKRDSGVPLCGGPRLACVGALPALFARSLRANYAGFSRGQGAAPDDPRREEGVLQVLRETPRQVPVWAGVLLQGVPHGQGPA